MLGLIGCSNTLRWEGESENWRAVVSSGGDSNMTTFTIKHIGESKELTNIYYKFEDHLYANGSYFNKTYPGSFKTQGTSFNKLDNEVDSISLIMKWNDSEEETLTLQKK